MSNRLLRRAHELGRQLLNESLEYEGKARVAEWELRFVDADRFRRRSIAAREESEDLLAGPDKLVPLF